MSGAINIAMPLATLTIALSGLLVMLSQRPLALRFFLAGAIAAAMVGIAPTVFGTRLNSQLVEIILTVAALAVVVAIIIGAWRTALICGIVAGLLVALLPIVLPASEHAGFAFGKHWLLLAGIALAALAALLMTPMVLRLLRAHVIATGSATGFERFVVRMLDAVLGPRFGNRTGDRRINDIGLTRRARQGRGPNAI